MLGQSLSGALRWSALHYFGRLAFFKLATRKGAGQLYRSIRRGIFHCCPYSVDWTERETVHFLVYKSSEVALGMPMRAPESERGHGDVGAKHLYIAGRSVGKATFKGPAKYVFSFGSHLPATDVPQQVFLFFFYSFSLLFFFYVFRFCTMCTLQSGK